jgi:hypothetical protein
MFEVCDLVDRGRRRWLFGFDRSAIRSCVEANAIKTASLGPVPSSLVVSHLAMKLQSSWARQHLRFCVLQRTTEK